MGYQEIFPVRDCISLADLLKRWEGKEIDGIALDYSFIAGLVDNNELDLYHRYGKTIGSGQACYRVWYDEQRFERLPLAITSEDPGNFLFLVEEIEKLERERIFVVSSEEEKDFYLPIDEVRKKLGMSPQRFVDMLDADRTPRLITTWEEELRNRGFYNSFFSIQSLSDPTLKVHILDYEQYQRELQEGQIAKDFDLFSPLPDQSERIAELEAALAEKEKEITTLNNFCLAWKEDRRKRQAEHERQMKELEAGKDGEIATLKARLEGLEAANRELEARAAAQSSCPAGKGLLALVCQLRGEGLSDYDIAEKLHEGGCSNPQVGALMYAQEVGKETLKINSDTLTQCAKRLLGKMT